ncbi:hypothetical protein C2G38_2050825 [Gigaspora rosea]|uniref:DEAD/DEAH box helicase domain-containing protein n=1 Tax=Gigaspora rosea TaxID=44941 RepID=A0A397TYJ9_9GLOM|nr:hypothetical protein C2G38_2050825 [Gigaspora rosea]
MTNIKNVGLSDVQCKDLEAFLRKIMKLPNQQSLITTIRTSANEAINRLKLNYIDKKTDYPKSFAAHHALAVLHNNVGLVEMLIVIREDLVPYGQIVQQSLETMRFHPSFATKISNFKTIIKCGGCQSFPIQYPNGLCLVCGFYKMHSCSQQIPNQVYQNKDKDKPDSKNRMLDAIVSKVFNFTEFRPKQRESIDSFTAGNDSLCILPTGGGKTFIYASSALLFMGLTVVFTPQRH